MAAGGGVAVELHHAIGFAGGVRDAVRWTPDGEQLVWPAGAVAVFARPDAMNDQRFLRGHSDIVTAVALSATGRLLATGQAGADSDVVVWEAETGKVVYRFEEHDHGVADVAISDDERVLASAGTPSDGSLVFWDLATGCIIARSPLKPSVTACLAFGGMAKDLKRRPTGLYQLASAGGNGLSLWALDPVSGAAHVTPVRVSGSAATRDFVSLDFSPSQEILAAGTTAGELALVDLAKRAVVKMVTVAGGGVGAVRWVGDGVVACGTREGQVVLIDIQAPGEPVAVMRQRVSAGGVTSLAWSARRGSLAVGCDDGRLAELSVPATLVRGESGGGRSGAGSFASAAGPGSGAAEGATVLLDSHCPAGKRLADGVAGRGSAGAAMAGAHGEAEALLNARTGAVACVSFAPGVVDAFVSGGEDGTVRLWSAEDYGVVAAAKEREAGLPQCCAQSLDLLAVGWEDGTLRGYSGETMEHLFTVPRAHKADAGGTSAVCVSNNERFALSGGGDGAVRVWELRSRELICDLRGHSARVAGACVFRDDVHAISASADRSIICWDLRKERRVSSHMQRLGAISAVALSHDQSVVITAGQSKNVTLWDLREPQPVHVIAGAHGGAEVTALAPLHNSDLLASGGSDGVVRLWDVRTCRSLADCSAHSSKVTGLAVAADDKQLVSVGKDGCVLVWDVFGAEGAAPEDA